MSWNLATEDGAFVSSGSTGQWEWGVPTSGPLGATSVWGTNLDGSHFNDAQDTLEIPLPDLSGSVAPVLVFEHWYDIRPGDRGVVEVNSGSGWKVVEPVYGYPDTAGFVGASGGWVTDSVLLAGYGPAPSVRLVLDADVLNAADGWYLRDVGIYDGDATPPRVSPIILPTDTQDLAGPYHVLLGIEDETEVVDAALAVQVDGGPVEVHAMNDLGDGTWEGFIPGQPAGSAVTWNAVASDAETEVLWPEGASESFSVFLAAPIDLEGPSGRLVADEIELTWTAPDSPHDVLMYLVSEEGSELPPFETRDVPALVPVDPDGDHVFAVAARYDGGDSAPSEPFAVDMSVPTVRSVTPQIAFQGDRVHVEVLGESLFLHRDMTVAALGEGIAVEQLQVLDANALSVVLTIDENAEIGRRTLQLSGTQGSFRFDEAFLVVDGSLRPDVLQVSPDRVTQGSTATIVVKSSIPFAGSVSVDPGEGLIVTSDVEVVDDEARFELLALGTAAPGKRLIILDDGTRLWSAEIDVREFFETGGTCAVGDAPPTIGWSLLALLAWRRRRSS